MNLRSSILSLGTASDGLDDFGANKRRRLSNGRLSIGDDFRNNVQDDDDFGVEDPFANLELYALAETVPENPSTNLGNLPWNYPSNIGLNSSAPAVDFVTGTLPFPDYSLQFPTSLDGFLSQDFVSFEAVLPERSSRPIPSLANPFADNAENRIPSLDAIASFAPHNGEVNGYLKFKILTPSLQHEEPSRRSLQYQSAKVREPRDSDEDQTKKPEWQKMMKRALQIGKEGSVVRNPPNFGLGCKLAPAERKIFRFYIDAWCSGRTILTRSNFWKIDLCPMLPSSEPVRNALLAMACTYILDYSRDERLRAKANAYYDAAVRAVGQKMQDPKEWEIGKGDDLVGAFVLLSMHDVVTWESRRAINKVARWLDGARTACRILDATDPGYRYYKPNNVQVSSARIGNSINIARFAIFGLPFTPLDIANTNNKKFGWLLYGAEDEVRKIHGASGYSRKLLHIWAQITHLAAKFVTDPDPDVIPVLAQIILDRIERLVQWSDFSDGYSSTGELLDACVTNAEGKIEEPWQMIALGAECWKKAAQIYLLCRLLRYPRTHPVVMAKLDQLTECLSRMPTSGSLFTSMTPLFPCFLLGILSVEERHRNLVLHWFNTVMGANQCRSCISPTWRSLNRLWRWMDTELIDPAEIPEAIENRDPWWEKMVTRIISTEGTLCVL